MREERRGRCPGHLARRRMRSPIYGLAISRLGSIPRSCGLSKALLTGLSLKGDHSENRNQLLLSSEAPVRSTFRLRAVGRSDYSGAIPGHYGPASSTSMCRIRLSPLASGLRLGRHVPSICPDSELRRIRVGAVAHDIRANVKGRAVVLHQDCEDGDDHQYHGQRCDHQPYRRTLPVDVFRHLVVGVTTPADEQAALSVPRMSVLVCTQTSDIVLNP